MAVDPIHQFEIHNVLPITQIGTAQIHLTNSGNLHGDLGGIDHVLLLLGTTGSRRWCRCACNRLRSSPTS